MKLICRISRLLEHLAIFYSNCPFHSPYHFTVNESFHRLNNQVFTLKFFFTHHVVFTIMKFAMSSMIKLTICRFSFTNYIPCLLLWDLQWTSFATVYHCAFTVPAQTHPHHVKNKTKYLWCSFQITTFDLAIEKGNPAQAELGNKWINDTTLEEAAPSWTSSCVEKSFHF